MYSHLGVFGLEAQQIPITISRYEWQVLADRKTHQDCDLPTTDLDSLRDCPRFREPCSCEAIHVAAPVRLRGIGNMNL